MTANSYQEQEHIYTTMFQGKQATLEPQNSTVIEHYFPCPTLTV